MYNTWNGAEERRAGMAARGLGGQRAWHGERSSRTSGSELGDRIWKSGTAGTDAAGRGVAASGAEVRREREETLAL
jgi:hypothetical protein